MRNFLQELAQNPDIDFDELVQSISDTLYQSFEAGGLDESNLPQLSEFTGFTGGEPDEWLVITGKVTWSTSDQISPVCVKPVLPIDYGVDYDTDSFPVPN